MLWWFYLQGIVTLLGAQLNVVLKERLHPRGLVDTPATEADYRAYEAYAKERTYHDNERVRTEFPRHPRGHPVGLEYSMQCPDLRSSCSGRSWMIVGCCC